jgi:hypothetical protein
MEPADYLRDQAVMYRKLAEQADDPVVKNEMLELASVCEEVANNIEDHLRGQRRPARRSCEDHFSVQIFACFAPWAAEEAADGKPLDSHH